jgi:hypothetical protein
MSFVKNQIILPNTVAHGRSSGAFKLCGKCNKDKPPEGGIEMSPTRWICAVCWTTRATRRKT